MSENIKYSKFQASMVILFFVIIVTIISIAFVVPKESAKQPELKIAKSTSWKMTPYFGKNFSFVAGYPKGWKEQWSEITPDLTYDDQILLSFVENTGAVAENSLQIRYFFDTGEDLATWVSKKLTILQSQKGYQPVQKNISASGVDYVQFCFLGNAKYSPMPDCFAYTQIKPYILELRTDSASPSFPVQQYIEQFISNFSLLKPGEDWSTFLNDTAGLSMKYPEDKYPFIADDPSQFINFTKQYIGQFLNIQILTDWTQGPIQYWYNELSTSGDISQLLPKHVILGGNDCYFADFNPSYSYEGIIGAKQFFCQLQNRLYVFTISTNDQPVDVDLYRMISSVKFL